MINLLSNAIKFTPKYGKNISIEIKNFKSLNLIYISVNDKGQGMTENIIKKIGTFGT